MKHRYALRLVAMLVIFTACQLGDKLAGPGSNRGPGALVLQLASPYEDDGALLFTVSGALVDSITSSNLEVASFEATTGLRHVLLRGAIHAGTVAQIWVPDLGNRAAYVATVIQAVSHGTYAQRVAADYAMTLK